MTVFQATIFELWCNLILENCLQSLTFNLLNCCPSRLMWGHVWENLFRLPILVFLILEMIKMSKMNGFWHLIAWILIHWSQTKHLWSTQRIISFFVLTENKGPKLTCSIVNLMKLFQMFHKNPFWVLFYLLYTYATCSMKGEIWILLVMLLTILHPKNVRKWSKFDCFQNNNFKSNISNIIVICLIV